MDNENLVNFLRELLEGTELEYDGDTLYDGDAVLNIEDLSPNVHVWCQETPVATSNTFCFPCARCGFALEHVSIAGLGDREVTCPVCAMTHHLEITISYWTASKE